MVSVKVSIVLALGAIRLASIGAVRTADIELTETGVDAKTSRTTAAGTLPAEIEKGLKVMTLNLQYMSSFGLVYDIDEHGKSKVTNKRRLAGAGVQLDQILEQEHAKPDVICAQEVLCSSEECSEVKELLPQYELVASSWAASDTIKAMVWDDARALAGLTAKGNDHLKETDHLLNAIFVRRNAWLEKVVAADYVQTNNDIVGMGPEIPEIGRKPGDLPPRSMTWVKLQPGDGYKPIIVMNTHISGGRFEDLYAFQQMHDERDHQVQQITNWFNQQREEDPEAVGVFVGDLNVDNPEEFDLAVTVGHVKRTFQKAYETADRKELSDVLVAEVTSGCSFVDSDETRLKEIMPDATDTQRLAVSCYRQYMLASRYRADATFTCALPETVAQREKAGEEWGPTSCFGTYPDYIGVSDASVAQKAMDSFRRFVMTPQNPFGVAPTHADNNLFKGDTALKQITDHNALMVTIPLDGGA